MTQPQGPPDYPSDPEPAGSDGFTYDQAAIEKEIWDAIAELQEKQQASHSSDPEEPDRPQPVDLRTLLSGEPAGEEWAVEPLFPAGKLVAVVSKRGEGKSLLMLDLAACVAIGQPTLHQSAGQPKPVIYLDMEMGPDDLYDRLTDLGYTPDHPHFDLLCQNLHYYLLPHLPPLDTEKGGEALEELVDRHRAQMVIVDTISRVVSGDENAAEPYRDLYRNTETRLKRRRITLARLDHLGKDPGKGSRGSSAKEDPMDVVWQLTLSAAGQLVFTLTKGRQSWLPRSVSIHRVELLNGTIKHGIPEEVEPEWLRPLIAVMDQLGIDPKLPGNAAADILREAGQGVRREKVSLAVRYRRNVSGNARAQNRETKPGTPPRKQAETEQQTLIDTGQKPGNGPGNGNGQVFPDVVPPKGRKQQDTHKFEPNLDDPDDTYEPEPEDLPDLLGE